AKVAGVIRIGVPEDGQRRSKFGQHEVGDDAREVRSPSSSRQRVFPWQGAEALTHRVHEPGHRWQTVGDDWITGLDGTRVLQPRATWRAGPNDDGAASRAM